MIRLSFIAALTLASVLIACSDRQPNSVPVPRPTAYPRIADPGAQYVFVDSLPIGFMANSATVISRPRPNWLDISYPNLHVTLHVSVTPTSIGDFDRVVANRSERIALNVADVSSTTEATIESPDFTSVLISSPETRSTPLQFLSHDGGSWVISGVAFFHDVAPDASIDSLSPIVSFLERDIVHALTNLSVK